MKDLNELLQQYEDIQDLTVSEEVLGAYIEGKTDNNETIVIEKAFTEDKLLSETLNESIDDNITSENIDWELYKGDFGFWELGLPPILSEEECVAADLVGVDDISENPLGVADENFSSASDSFSELDSSLDLSNEIDFSDDDMLNL